MTRECYRTLTGAINSSPGLLGGVLAALAIGLFASVIGVAQDAAPAPDAWLSVLSVHARAHPHAMGPVTLVRHEHAHGRTTTERGTLHLDPTGARLTLDRAELALTPTQIEAFDGDATPPRVLLQRGETPLARYAAWIGGEDLGAMFSERVLSREGGRVRLELLPRVAWLGLERVVVRALDEGADRGRIERVLWLDGLGNWQRLDVEQLRYPARIDPRMLLLSPHPGARRIEI